MSETPKTAEIKPAATILLLRDAPAFEVLMVKRHHQIDFASGALVFPGGKSHAGDHDPNWEVHTVGWEAYDADQRALRIAAMASTPSIPGIRKSISTTSGRVLCASASPSSADPAMPVTTICFSLSSMVRSPSRTTG